MQFNLTDKEALHEWVSREEGQSTCTVKLLFEMKHPNLFIQMYVRFLSTYTFCIVQP